MSSFLKKKPKKQKLSIGMTSPGPPPAMCAVWEPWAPRDESWHLWALNQISQNSRPLLLSSEEGRWSWPSFSFPTHPPGPSPRAGGAWLSSCACLGEQKCPPPLLGPFSGEDLHMSSFRPAGASWERGGLWQTTGLSGGSACYLRKLFSPGGRELGREPGSRPSVSWLSFSSS